MEYQTVLRHVASLSWDLVCALKKKEDGKGEAVVRGEGAGEGDEGRGLWAAGGRVGGRGPREMHFTMPQHVAGTDG